MVIVKNENIYRRETLTKEMYVNIRERDFVERKLMEWLKRKTWLEASANPPEEVFESWGGSCPSAGPRLEYFGG